jgi:hypothetical protein
MSNGRTKDDFLEFLEWLGAKGLIPANTAHGRKAVANKVLATLEPSELVDVTTLDVDDVIRRFTNKAGKRYTPDSLRTYQSRFESSISDFRAYCENPVGFRPPGRSKSPSQSASQADAVNGSAARRATKPKPKTEAPKSLNQEMSRASPTNIVPVQIRENLTISVGPIPFDLTEAEAKRVANVILALARDG